MGIKLEPICKVPLKIAFSLAYLPRLQNQAEERYASTWIVY